ncbi:P-loop NTPase family protein [Nocardioides ochotonae]|uniref:GTPase n=1 Tax=Nocardioides ochotonae TaxID=2685869 RepID=UPI001CD43E88|nr:GTPase [Nocardioides ochotonae]
MTPSSPSLWLDESSSEGVRMVTALVRLRGALQAAVLPLDLAGVEGPRAVRRELVDQLEDYVIPRMTTLEAPMLVVVGGSTGAGKSTLVNSLVGRRVTEPGVLRPTTRSAVLVHHPDDAEWFGQDRLLPDLRRVEAPTKDHDALQLVADASVPRGLAIIDAPDVDSVEKHNRELATQLLAAADMWLFVTSAARYADQVPWEHLKQAAARSIAVAIVLDRTAPDAVSTVSTHLARMLASRGLKDSPLFVVHEGQVDEEGLLPAGAVADIRGWLDSLARDVDARGGVVRQTMEGTVKALTHQLHPVADAVAQQAEAVAELREAVDTTYEQAADELVAAAGDGTLLRGDLLAGWQEFVGTGELLRTLEDKVGWLRERLVSAVKGKPQQAEQVSEAVETALGSLVLAHAELAATRAAQAWSAHPAGPGLLGTEEGAALTRPSAELRRNCERAVRDWQAEVTELVRTEGADKRTSARFLVYGVPGLSVALMVLTLDGGSTESAGLGRRLLEAVFGAETVATLERRSREGLTPRLRALLDAEASRWQQHLESLGVTTDAAEQLRQATRRVDDVRFGPATRGGEAGD